jgi:ABC-type lipoprotein export system ATPase subunit
VELLLDECQRAGAGIVAATHDPDLLARFQRTVAVHVDDLGVARIAEPTGTAS